MDSASQSLFVCNALEKLCELAALGIAQRGQKSPLVLACNTADILERPSPWLGQVQGIAAPILRIVSTFDEAAFFKLIDERNHPRRHH